MPLIVNPSAAYDWTYTREQVCTRALQKIREIGEGETPSDAQMTLCLNTLDAILKNLPWHGYAWPKRIPASTSLSITANVQTKVLPADFYGEEFLSYIVAGSSPAQEIFLDACSPEQWKSIPEKTNTAAYPDRYFIDNFNTLYLYPIPNQAITLQLYYQQVIQDTIANTATQLDSPWMLGLVYGIASEIGDEFNVPLQTLQRFEAKWLQQRELGIQNESFPGPDRIQVDD